MAKANTRIMSWSTPLFWANYSEGAFQTGWQFDGVQSHHEPTAVSQVSLSLSLSLSLSFALPFALSLLLYRLLD